jgi:STIP1 family protein 1
MYERVIDDALTSIKLMPENMKAYYHLAQAQIALHQNAAALESSKKAHGLCVEEIHRGGKGGSSIGAITELVLRCKKEWWEEQEDKRVKARPGLLQELERDLEGKIPGAVEEALRGSMVEDPERTKQQVEREYQGKIEELRRVFEKAGAVEKEGKRRRVPDWCLDDITFSVMLDPVVVSSFLSSGFG